MTKIQDKGNCDCCSKLRVVSPIESGQQLCGTCLKELHPPRPKCLATIKQIEKLRESGIPATDDLTKDEYCQITSMLGDAYHYVLDLWECYRGTRVIYDDLLSGYNQREQVYQFVAYVWTNDRELVERVSRVQSERDSIAKIAYEADPANVADESVYPSSFKPDLKPDRDYKAIGRYLRHRYKGF